jgi:hypothetical protein
MSLDIILGLGAAVIVLVYCLVALIRPELF